MSCKTYGYNNFIMFDKKNNTMNLENCSHTGYDNTSTACQTTVHLMKTKYELLQAFFVLLHHNPNFRIHFVFTSRLQHLQLLFGRLEFFKFQFPFTNA